ncbi:MAG: hypothetical protein K2X86_04890 [Cytophagaceae bacterium]|nr:hypothetical protein [Cytophagaceae bacterium]
MNKIAFWWPFKYRYLLIIAFAVTTIIIISFTFSFNPSKEKIITNPDFIYNTWKVEKLYRNGKLVINSSKYNNLYFQVHRDGTAEWIKGNKRLKVHVVISPDGGQIISDDGMRMEEVESVFELKQNILRFGKRSINSHYEYVMTAADVSGTNFF